MTKEKKKSVAKDVGAEIPAEMIRALLQPTNSPEFQKTAKRLAKIVGLEGELLVGVEDAGNDVYFGSVEHFVEREYGEVTLREAADYLKVTQQKVLHLADQGKLSLRHIPTTDTSADGSVSTMILVSAASIAFYKTILDALDIMEALKEITASERVPVSTGKMSLLRAARDVLPPEEFQERFGKGKGKTVRSRKPSKVDKKKKK